MAAIEKIFLVVGLSSFIGFFGACFSLPFCWKELKRIFDPLLFNEEYFNPFQLEFFTGIFSFGRIGSYAAGVVDSRKRIVKRYKGIALASRVSRKTRRVCQVFSFFAFLGMLGFMLEMLLLPFV